VMIAPFGCPVVPEVYMIMPISSCVSGTGVGTDAPEARARS